MLRFLLALTLSLTQRYPQMVRTFLFPLVLLCIGSGPAFAHPYEMIDLRALEQQDCFEELLEHARDIAPRARDQEWQGLVSRAATQVVRGRALRGQEEQAATLADQMLALHPFLKRATPFLDARADVGLKAAESCMRAGEDSSCWDQLDLFVRTDPTHAPLAFRAGKLVRKFFRPTASMLFFHEALLRQPGAVLKKDICSDEVTIEAVRWSLGLPAGHRELKAAAVVGFEVCFEEMKAGLVDELVHSTLSSAVARHLCSGLIEKKMLTPFQMAYCQDAAP